MLFAPFRFVFSAIASVFKLLWSIIAWVFGFVFGQWTPPPWLQLIIDQVGRYFRFLGRHRWLAVLHVILPPLLLVGSVLGYVWYQSLPQPVTTSFTARAPAKTTWDGDQPNIQPLYVRFTKSAAPLKRSEEALTEGVHLSPQTAGEWRWQDDYTLIFEPQQDWKINSRYTVTIAEQGLVAEQILLEKTEDSFTTAGFEVYKRDVEFYQDPVDPNQKKVIASLRFSHPVDAVTLERNIQIKPQAGLEFINNTDKPFSVIYSDDKLSAHIHTAALAVPRLDRQLEIEIDSGIEPAAGGDRSDNSLRWKQNIPGRGKLALRNPDIEIVENGSKPEQVLMVHTSAPVAEKLFAEQVQLWLLPKYAADQKDKDYLHYWHNNNVTNAVMARAERIHPHYIQGEFENSQLHQLKLDVPQDRYLLIKMEPGLTAVGGYELVKRYSQVVQVPSYPKILKFMSQGNLLSLHGEKKVAVVSRGHQHFSYEVQRILPDQLHHFIADNGSDPASPTVSSFDMSKIIERFTGQQRVRNKNPKTSSTSSLNLGRYLNNKGLSRGLFVVNLSPREEAPDYEFGALPHTRRLIAITDMGLMVKRNKDGEHDVFVVSLSSGRPVANAQAKLISLNGQSLQTVTTDYQGRAHFRAPRYRGSEKRPLAFVVSKNGDSAFIPYSGGNREINYSRFDIGGVNDSDGDELSAFAFSDRELYRPGESARLMYIVRAGDWRPAYEGMPVQLEIYDPRGMSIYKQRRRLHRSGFDALEFDLSAAALTGDYRFKVSRVHNGRYEYVRELGSVRFNVREFEPDRLKVKARLSDDTVRGWLRPNEVAGRVNVQHLFGTPAAGARVVGEMNIRQAWPQFAQYPDYRFFDRSSADGRLSDSYEYLGEQFTDDQGDTLFELDLSRFERATYRLHFNTTSYEKGSGRGVNANTSLLVSDAPYMIGFKADGRLNVKHNSERNVQFIAVDSQLQQVEANTLRLEKSEIRYVSVLARQPNGSYRYVSRQREFTLNSEAVSIGKNGLQQRLDTSSPGEYRLRLRNDNDEILATLNYQVAGTANLTRSLERNAELQVSLDNDEYRNGDSIEISIIAPYTGTGLITIERDKVYASQWFKTSTTSSVQTIRVPRELEGNAYINVQFIREADSPEIYMSPLSVAVVPFNINRSARIIDAKMSSSERVRPGDDIRMTVNTPESSRLILVAVDEGILQVAKFRTPDPLSHFLQKRRLQVSTRQMLDLILPEYSQIMASAPGGGMAEEVALAQNLNPFKKKRNPPVVWWSGVRDIQAGEHEFNFRAPDYFNGRVRIYAVLANENRMQVLEQSSLVQGDLILTPNVPVAVSPGDEVNLSLAVYNNIKPQQASAASSNTIDVELQLPAGASVIGDAKRQLTLNQGQDQLVEFRVRLGDEPGEKTLQFRASSGDYQARYRESVSVRPASPYRTVLQAGVINGGEQQSFNDLRQLHNAFAEAEVDVGASPLLWARGLASYLNNYSHMCTEQLTSRAVPALLLQAYPALTDSSKTFDIPAALSMLRGRQNDEGGFGMWRATLNADPYYTLFALNFMLEAKDRNQAVPDDMLNQSLSFVQDFVSRPHSDLAELRMAAYGVYLIARSGQTPGNRLTAVQSDLEKYFPQQWQQDLAAAYLAAALQLQRQETQASSMMRRLNWHSGKPGKASRVILFQDALSENAIHLYLLMRHFPQLFDTLPQTVLLEMADAISQQRYHSHSAAWMMLALDAYHQRANQRDSDALAFISQADNSEPTALALSRNHFGQHAELPLNSHTLRLDNANDLPLFYALRHTGYDRTASPASSHGVEIQRDFTDLDGKLKNQFTVGDEFLVRLRLRTLDDNYYQQLAIVDLLPGGIEPVPVINPVHQEDSEHSSRVLTDIDGPWSLDYDNLRDDRLMLYGSLYGDGTVTLSYKVRAVSAGRFTVPVAFTRALYQPEVFSITAAGELQIDKPNNSDKPGNADPANQP